MPQFDAVSFAPQLIWLGFTFLPFYFILTRYFLPTWATTLKTRQKSLSSKSIISKQDHKVKSNLWIAPTLKPVALDLRLHQGSIVLLTD